MSSVARAVTTDEIEGGADAAKAAAEAAAREQAAAAAKAAADAEANAATKSIGSRLQQVGKFAWQNKKAILLTGAAGFGGYAVYETEQHKSCMSSCTKPITSSGPSVLGVNSGGEFFIAMLCAH